MASKNPKITVTYTPEKLEEIQRYAESAGLTPANLMKYALQQHLNRYPKRFHQKGVEGVQAVQEKGSEANSQGRAG